MTEDRADSLISADVARSLGQSGQTSEVLAHVKNGQVHLSGDVPTHEAKRAAETLVASINGVRGVHSDIHVDTGARSLGERGQAVAGATDQRDAARLGDIDLDDVG